MNVSTILQTATASWIRSLCTEYAHIYCTSPGNPVMLVLDMGGQIDSISCIYWGGTELPIVSDSYASRHTRDFTKVIIIQADSCFKVCPVTNSDSSVYCLNNIISCHQIAILDHVNLQLCLTYLCS
jgi:hypothetical protein